MVRRGCIECQKRHLKCVILNSETCDHCVQANRPCLRPDPLRFRHVVAVKNKERSSEQSLKFLPSQPWVEVSGPLFFVKPETRIEYSNPTYDLSGKEPIWNSAASESDDAFISPSQVSIGDNAYSVELAVSSQQEQCPELNQLLRLNEATLDTAVQCELPKDIASLNQSDVQSLLRTNTHTLISPPPLQWPVRTEREARLFHHFIVHCTPWVDICDPYRNFQTEVPKRATQCAAILNGILGLAARHVWLVGKAPYDLSQSYVGSAMRELIAALEDPIVQWDEDFLIAVIILRLHEEMGELDYQCHHFGSARVLNSISAFATNSGLRESASWISLRQHVTVSLIHQQPLDLNLSNFRLSNAFRAFPLDNESWTNRIIFHFASILQQALSKKDGHHLTKEEWTGLEASIEEWSQTKPWYFNPLSEDFSNARHEFAGFWPYMPTTHGVIAVGLQFYHLCRILLILYSPYTRPGLLGARQRIGTDAAIREHIRVVIGYGMSNSHCPNALFQGGHILSVCGAYIIAKPEQDACVEYLKYFQQTIGWQTKKSVSDLRYLWSL